MTSKFRRCLEPYVNATTDGPRHKGLRPTGNLIIGLSGGLGSTVLLDLVYRLYISPDLALRSSEGGSNHPMHERVWKKVYVCYVETSDALPGVSTCQRTFQLSPYAQPGKSRRRIERKKSGPLCRSSLESNSFLSGSKMHLTGHGGRTLPSKTPELTLTSTLLTRVRIPTCSPDHIIDILLQCFHLLREGTVSEVRCHPSNHTSLRFQPQLRCRPL